MISENVQGNDHGRDAGGLGPLFSGLIAATLIALTLLAAVTLGMGEQQMLAQVEPSPTDTAVPTVAIPSPSPSATFTPVPSSTSVPTLSPTAPEAATLAPEPTPTSTETRKPAPSPTVCRENPFGWDYIWEVRSGETLFSIGRDVGETWETLRDANCLTGTLIRPGDELFVPRPRPTPVPTRTPKPTVAAPVIATFTLDPPEEVILGDCVLLSWVVQGVIEKITLTADGSTLLADAPETGDYSDCPAEAGTRRYVLKAEGPDKNSYETAEITVIDGSPVADFTYRCTDLSCHFDGSGSYDPDGAIVSYEWDFGDGATGSGTTPSYEYASGGTYNVVLTVTDDGGATGTVSQNVTISVENDPPVSSFTYDCTGLSCDFDGSGSDDSDGTIVSYAWDFDDGATGSGATPSHPYAAGGTYSVSLTVTDDDGATGTVSKNVSVNAPPVAGFTYDPTGLSCDFDGSGSDDSDGIIVSYAWDFGDGSGSGSGATTNYTYAADGTYTVSLTVTDDGGATDTVSQSVTVSESGGAESGGFVSFSVSVTPRTIALMRTQDQPLPT